MDRMKYYLEDECDATSVNQNNVAQDTHFINL